MSVNSEQQSAVEMNVGIICACLPCLGALVKYHFPNFVLFRRDTRMLHTLGTLVSAQVKDDLSTKDVQVSPQIEGSQGSESVVHGNEEGQIEVPLPAVMPPLMPDPFPVDVDRC